MCGVLVIMTGFEDRYLFFFPCVGVCSCVRARMRFEYAGASENDNVQIGQFHATETRNRLFYTSGLARILSCPKSFCLLQWFNLRVNCVVKRVWGSCFADF